MTPEQKQLEQIQERRAQVENGDLDYATSDTGKGYCVGYIYEKASGAEVARMSSLYDVMRGNFFANAAADIDFLLSLVKSQEAAMLDTCVLTVKKLRDKWLKQEGAHLGQHGECVSATALAEHVSAASKIINELERQR